MKVILISFPSQVGDDGFSLSCFLTQSHSYGKVSVATNHLPVIPLLIQPYMPYVDACIQHVPIFPSEGENPNYNTSCFSYFEGLKLEIIVTNCTGIFSHKTVQFGCVTWIKLNTKLLQPSFLGLLNVS